MSTIAATAPSTGPALGKLVARALLAATLTLALVLAVPQAVTSPPAGEAVIPEAAPSLAFVPNAGQSDPRVHFMAQGAGYAFFFTDGGVTLTLSRGDAKRSLALELDFRDANPDVRPVASGEATGTVNYLTGPREDWVTGLEANSELTYPELWPGIDMVFRGEGGRLKYEFHVAPGADPSRIRLAYRGAEGLALGAGGALHVKTALGSLTDSPPVSYQRQDGRRVPVESSYQMHGATGYGFAVSGYDASRPLVIDPGLAYSTYLGGGTTSGHDDSAFGLAVDSAGSAYLTGTTTNPAFPTTPGAFDTTLGGQNAFVTKLSADGSSLVYSTYLGGAQIDNGLGIAVDGQGSAYVSGSTSSPDFPVTQGSYDPVFGQSTDAFVTKLNPTGSSLVYSSYLGGGVQDSAQAIALDAAGNAYVTGFTSSNAFPTTPGAVDSTFGAGNTDVFVTKFNPAGSSLVYSTYLSGNGIGEQGNGIAVDGAGSAYVTGFAGQATLGTQVDYPTTAGAFDTTQNGGSDVFVTKLNPTGSALDYSTFLGGATTDQGEGIALGGDGSAHVTGRTASTAYPTTTGAFDEGFNSGTHDAFVTKLNPSGSALGYSTYLGGTGNEFGLAVDVDGQGRALVTGTTASTGFPTTAGAFDQSFNLGFDAFATRLDTGGATLSYSSFLGGNAVDEGHGIAVDAGGDMYVAGLTESSNYPTTPGAFDTSGGGAQNREAFVTKLDEGGVAPACSDGADNDGDGKTDHPADPGCSGPSDSSESPDPPPPAQCADGQDNDGDAKTDHPADPGCASAADNSESPDPPPPAQCDDGQDNDGDGKTDHPADPGCSSAADNSESPNPGLLDPKPPVQTSPPAPPVIPLQLGTLAKPTIQVVSQSPRVQGARAAARVNAKTDPVQLHSKWTVKWSGPAAADSWDVWYRKLASGVPAPDWEDLLDTSDGDFPPTPWKSDVTSKKAKLTADAGFTYCFAVIASAPGKASPPAHVCTAMPHKANKLGRSSNHWQVKSAGGYYGGGYLRWNGPNGIGGGKTKRLYGLMSGTLNHLPGPRCTSPAVSIPSSNCPDKLPYYPEGWTNLPPPYCGPTYDPPGCAKTATWPSWPRLKRIVLVATKCASCGKVLVTAEGSPLIVGQPFRLKPVRWQKMIDLEASKMKKRQLITVKTYANPFSNTFPGWVLRIYPQSGHPRIEGLALASGR